MIRDLLMDDYRKEEWVSNSFLIEFDKSPAHAFTPKEPTDAMKFGTMLHTFILEPEIFDQNYFVSDKLHRGSKEFKTLQEKYPQHEIIFSEDYAKLQTVRDNLWKKNINGVSLKDIMQKSVKELSMFWNQGGIKRKARIDAYNKELNIALDLKKTSDASAFHWSIKNYKYYRQAAWYSDALEQEFGKVPEFYLVVMEDTEPFGIKIFQLSTEYILSGQIENEASVIKYKQWGENGADKTLNYPDVIDIIEKPNYLL